MEVYTLLALEFCDGEDLMSLYWSTWTMLQVGSLIAVVGIILALCLTIRDKKHPLVDTPASLPNFIHGLGWNLTYYDRPWALALGTPVLVIAGSFHFLHGYLHNILKESRKKKEEEKEKKEREESDVEQGETLSRT